MKLIDKQHSTESINKHTLWVYEQDGRQLAINRNHDIGGDQFYIFDVAQSGGEGCRTIWYPSLEVARKEVERLFTSNEAVVTGTDSKLCADCQNHYSPYTPKGHESKRYWNKKTNVCQEFKTHHSLLFCS